MYSFCEKSKTPSSWLIFLKTGKKRKADTGEKSHSVSAFGVRKNGCQKPDSHLFFLHQSVTTHCAKIITAGSVAVAKSEVMPTVCEA